MKEKPIAIYKRLLKKFGPQGWWPGETPFEVVIGAVLTQNTNWLNVEKAIANIKDSGLMELERLAGTPEKKLARLIKPSGYFNIKAKRLKAVIAFLIGANQGDWLKFLKKTPLDKARDALLSVYGIGPETADSILLYAAERPTFVIDKYTLRFGTRYGLFPENRDYGSARKFFMNNLPCRVKLFNEYHALLVAVGKHYCKTKPVCEGCPVANSCGRLLV